MKGLTGVLLVAAFLGPVGDLDRAVRDAVQAGRRPALEGPMRTLTAIGRPVIVLGGLAAIAVLDRSAGPRTARDALLALAPTNALVEGLKRLTFRPRPDGEHRRSNAAFPSSHAANAFALAAVLARRWRRAGWGLFPFAAAVAASRMYLDRHWLSDVVVGTAIGLASAWLVARLLRARAARSTGGLFPPSR
jgi:undecaprenyl-diphosphatase